MVPAASAPPTSSCRTASLLLAGLFVAFLVTQAPHLVHHFFEPDHVQNECPFAASGERASGLQVEPVAVVVHSETSTLTSVTKLPVPSRVTAAAFLGRAPPVSAA